MSDGQFQREEYGFFDGELPPDVLADFPIAEPEQAKRLRSQFTDTHHRSVARRYPELRSAARSRPQTGRYYDNPNNHQGDAWTLAAEHEETAAHRPYVDNNRHPRHRFSSRWETHDVRESSLGEWIIALIGMALWIILYVSQS